jgi:hypothetical protein
MATDEDELYNASECRYVLSFLLSFLGDLPVLPRLPFSFSCSSHRLVLYTATLPRHVYVSSRDDMELRQILNKLKSDSRFAVPERRWGSPQSCPVTDDIVMGHNAMLWQQMLIIHAADR